MSCQLEPLPELIRNWFDSMHGGIENLEVHTELVRYDQVTGESQKFRAHPNYLNNGPWYDYVMISYENDECAPARVACFFQDPKEPSIKKMLVQPAVDQTEDQLDLSEMSMLFNHWTLGSERKKRDSGCSRSVRWQAKLEEFYVDTIADSILAFEACAYSGGAFWRENQEDETSLLPPLNLFDIVVSSHPRSDWPQAFLDSTSYLKEAYKKQGM